MSSSVSAYARRGKITDSLLSKSVLAPIASGHAPPAALVEHLGLADEIPRIVDLYRRHGPGGAHAGEPKYLPFYRAIQARFPGEFAWRIVERGPRPRVDLHKPFINFARPSLLTLVTCCVRDQAHLTPALGVRYPATRDLPNALVFDLERLMKDSGFHMPHADYMRVVSDTLRRGLGGEQITLVSPVCPDYGFERARERMRYTFDQLGDGVGLVAGRVVKALPGVQDLLTRHGIRSRLVVAARDFEGFDESTVRRVGETRESFQAKLARSQERVLRALGRPAESMFIASSVGGEAPWRALTARAHRSLTGEDFDTLMPTRVDLDAILDTRMPLYQAWHPGRSREELTRVLLEQCAEYAAMGALFHRMFPNPLVIGGDHNRMMPFYWVHQRIAVLYLKRIY